MKLLETVIGSHMHSMANKSSDIDTRAVVVSSLMDFIDPFSDPKTTHKINGKDDHVEYELRHFLRLLSKGSPSVIDVLYAPAITVQSDMAEELIQNRVKFIDKTATIKAFKGYASHMIRNAQQGIRPYKSLRSALLTGCVTLACVNDSNYTPLTFPNAKVIIKYSLEGDEANSMKYLIESLDEVASEISTASYVNHYNQDYVKDYCFRTYTEGEKYEE